MRHNYILMRYLEPDFTLSQAWPMPCCSAISQGATDGVACNATCQPAPDFRLGLINCTSNQLLTSAAHHPAGDGELNEGKYRDQSFYLGRSREGRPPEETFQLDREHAELAAAVMDLTAEDADGMAASKRKFHWDKRKRQYIQLGKDETIKGV